MAKFALTALFAVALMLAGCSTSSNPSDPSGGFAVTGVSPAGGGPGDSVTLDGSGFGDGSRTSQVIFLSTPATQVNYWSDTEISVVVPQGLPQWSKVDVFVRTGREDSDSWQFHSLPSGWKQITDNGSDDCYHLSWGYGDVLYFSSTRAQATNFDVYYTYADDGTPTTQVSFGAGTDDQPVGTQTKLAFASQNGTDTDIRFFDGGSATWLTDDEYDDRWPDFNPYAGGDYELAFTKGVWNAVDEVVEYYIYGSRGYPPPEAITYSVGGDFQPSWSPDGAEIAFIRAASVHKVEVATHGVTQLTSGYSDSYPDWGLDGRIIWIRSLGALWVMDGDGSNQQVLLDPPDYLMSAAWSPGQDRVAMILLLSGQMDIYVYELP